VIQPPSKTLEKTLNKHIIASALAITLALGTVTAAEAHGHRGWGHHHHGGWWGWGPGGGFLTGLGLGALGGYLVGSNPPVQAVEDEPMPAPVTAPQMGRDPGSLCAAKYKSYNPQTGLFKSTDGTQKICPYLK
jgi:hypothetical protein